MSYCKNFRAVLTAQDGANLLLARARCKQWTCTHCADVNRRQWQARLIDYINQSVHDKWSWWTLTAHSRMRGALNSLKNLRDAWEKLIKRMRRKFGKFEYCRVYERHKDGSYHLHVISSFHFGDIKTRKGKEVNYSPWLAKQARDLSIGWYTHADDIESHHHGGYVASYVTKYISKLSVEAKKELGRVRHIQTSQAWAKLEQDKNDLKWELTDAIWLRDMAKTHDSGGDVIEVSDGRKLTYDDFGDKLYYPNREE